ncbi:uncharacterized protein LOC127870930 [Dreissena polymorpha]|uniref:Uncharacterized protein n=1 Tax=Dreissena polymorpha TaxID=45954 RepID=A0A9D4R5Z1_DREPO|nr:uncharacterized protein LOC127870930 [Dreissena polymorpha]KAH3855137.1 hypothetical protein DPMN_097698 [Dreissena polymorpha]
MPGDQKLYGLQGPQNSTVLMEIITKLKQDLQHSRSENSKLVDQLNCLISLVRRAWSGEQGAIMHLANIVGMEPPTFGINPDMNRNTPMPDKSRAVLNWERLSVKLLEKDYKTIQEDIRMRQELHIQNREQYMNEVLEDHQQEMGKFNLRKKSATNIEEVDKQFLRCYSAKSKSERRVQSAKSRPRSGFKGHQSKVADMADRAGVRVEDILGQQQQQQTGMFAEGTEVFQSLHKMNGPEKLLYRRKESFADPNRYKQSNLFDPDVIFSPDMMGTKGRPSSASSVGSKVRPTSAFLITEGKPERPLKYETTRPVSGKSRPASGKLGGAGKNRIKSASLNRTAPATFVKKNLHSKSANQQADDNSFLAEADVNQNGNQNSERSGVTSPDNDQGEASQYTDQAGRHSDDSDENVVENKPPMAVKVKKGHDMDKFVNELKMMAEMENDFKKSVIQFQKKLGLETGGFVYS